MGSSFFSNPTDYEVVQEGGEGSSFYDGPAYTEIDPVAINNSVAEAAASAAAALGSAASSASSASAALVSETNAAASAASVGASEAAAAASATAASGSATTATAQATIATTQAGNAATSAAAALVSEGNADTSASAASTSASNAATSETNAATSASSAATSASNAATSEANAAAAVQAAKGTATPLMDGSAAVGTGVKWAKEDHVHPTDTSRAPLASPTFTGTPAAPTPSTSDNSTKVATTAFVKAYVPVGAWTAYTPTVTSQTGTLTSASATGSYIQIGKTVYFRVTVTITTNGTGATAIITTLPVTAVSAVFTFAGRANAISGKLLICYCGGIPVTNLGMTNYDGTYPGQNGEQLIVSGVYEAA